MTFDEVLPALKEGRRATRAIWHAGQDIWKDAYVELVSLWTQDDRKVMPVLMVGRPDQDILRPFAGANWDLLADDWEIL